MQAVKLTIQQKLWLELIASLREKGKGVRESGAVLLAENGSSEITRFICWDELDPHAFDSGIVRVNTSAFRPLWDVCFAEGLRVVADVHTHPSEWTGQSGSDIRHPIIHQAGHIAMIIPCYAKKKQRSLKGVGIYEYLGSYQWREQAPNSGAFKIIKDAKHHS